MEDALSTFVLIYLRRLGSTPGTIYGSKQMKAIASSPRYLPNPACRKLDTLLRPVTVLTLLSLVLCAGAATAAPPAPDRAAASCDAVANGGRCYVDGSFTLFYFSPGAHYYRICRSNDTSGWGGCNVVMTSNTGPTYTVDGSHLPSDGFRRAYYIGACDASSDCSTWAENDEVYVQMDLTGPSAPGPTTISCAYSEPGQCWVTGSFTATVAPASDSGSGVDAESYNWCRSHDSPGGFAGCQSTLTTSGGTSFTVSGAELPANGFRRAYWVRVKDNVGNWSPWNTPRYVRVDRHNPTVSADNASTEWFTSRTATVTAADAISGTAANSGLAEVRYRWNVAHNGSCTTGTATTAGGVLTVPPGDNHLYLCAKDRTDRVGFWDGGPYRVFAATCPIQNQVESRPCDLSRGGKRFGRLLEPASDFEIHQKLIESFVHYTLESIDLDSLRRDLDAKGRMTMFLNGSPYELVLEPNELRASSYQETIVTAEGDIDVPRAAVNTFAGHVAGYPGSDVRLLVDAELVMGYVELDGKRFFVDPAYKFVPGGGADRVVVYEDGDLRQQAAGVSCAVTELHEHADRLWDASESDGLALQFTGLEKNLETMRRVEIATDADYEYWDIHGSNTNNHILGVLNMVNGFYADAGLVFTVTSQRTFDSQGGDPYETCHTYGQWCELWREWETNRQHVARDVAYLFSGKALYLDSSQGGEFRVRGTSGLAGTICDRDRAYVLSTDYREAGLVSHELGHAFNARHLEVTLPEPEFEMECPDVDCGASTCPDPTPIQGGPVMCGSIQNPTTAFHPVSISAITSFVASSGSCLTVLNRAPQAVDDFLTTPRDTRLSIPLGAILGNDSDPDGDALYLRDYEQETAAGGTNDTGHVGGFNYTPPAGYVGTDTFTYTVADRAVGGLTDTATVTIAVTSGAVSGIQPWRENANGSLATNLNWNYAMGYHFTPEKAGSVTELGGFFNGTKIVRLFNKSTGALLAQASVTAANDWAYVPITPVALQGETTYTVAVYLAGSGGSYRNGITSLPQVYGPIRIEGSTYISTQSNPSARPTRTVTSRMYGQADIRFEP